MNKLYSSRRGTPKKVLKAVQVTDIHVDYKYTVGADAQCNNYLCCRPESGFPTEPEKQAKYWGSFKCDVPPYTVQNMLEFIKEEIKPDVIFWTGDNSPHNIWNNSYEEIIDSTINITKMFKDVFEGTNIPVYPI